MKFSYELSHLALDTNGLVNPFPFPPTCSSVEQTQLMIGIPGGATNEASEVEADSRDAIAGSAESGIPQSLDFEQRKGRKGQLGAGAVLFSTPKDKLRTELPSA